MWSLRSAAFGAVTARPPNGWLMKTRDFGVPAARWAVLAAAPRRPILGWTIFSCAGALSYTERAAARASCSDFPAARASSSTLSARIFAGALAPVATYVSGSVAMPSASPPATCATLL
jgi:hypothetical protein